ncbi:MAG: hypothetical protein NTV88_03190 [Candidatus Micrarchaeota archaeon]|nr:hypothetical protein [Candidatus Micrarchaeota archaeon]
MDFNFVSEKKREFLQLNSFMRVLALSAIAVIAFGLTFLVFPFMDWKLHFFQAGIFAGAFLFGPFAGAAVGALSSSYSGLYVLNNPWIIGGNALLGFAAAYFFTRMHPMKAVLAAFAVMVPYLIITDVFLMHMPVAIFGGILATLFIEAIACGAAAWKIAEVAKPYLSKA